MSLEGRVAWVIGGVGVTGRGIARGLLQAGATVIVNSKHAGRLRRLSDDLNAPSNLITLEATMVGAEAAETTARAMSLTGGRLDHVVAHSSVRWLSGPAACDELDVAPTTSHTSWDLIHGGQGAERHGDILAMELPSFVSVAAAAVTQHFSAAQQLVPRLHGVEGATYMFVNGGAGPRGKRTPLSQINTQSVWGLAAALRNHGREHGVRMSELRVEMCIDRTDAERVADPLGFGHAVSADLGAICAGVAVSRDSAALGVHSISAAADVRDLKARFPAPHVGRELPLQWDITAFATAL